MRSFKKNRMKINVISSMTEADEKPPTAWDHHDNKKHGFLRQLLQPSITTMKMCGCYSFDAGGSKAGLPQFFCQKAKDF